jgi:hypothetical protein
LSTKPRKEVAKSANHAVKKRVFDEREKERESRRVLLFRVSPDSFESVGERKRFESL